MSPTTFSAHHIVPEGRSMLTCSCVLPGGCVKVPLPDESYDLDNPTVFLPLVVCMAPYSTVMFTIAARPAFDDGTVAGLGRVSGRGEQPSRRAHPGSAGEPHALRSC